MVFIPGFAAGCTFRHGAAPGRLRAARRGLAEFPRRGSPRDDVREGMRTIPFRRRATITYSVVGEDVIVDGVFYGGQDFSALLDE